jgi:signal transduction histidine kinase
MKQNEEYERELSRQANERRRQQEIFVDIFSHELRNPFSATLQCADAIFTSLESSRSARESINTEELMDYAKTILFCVNHQKRYLTSDPTFKAQIAHI